jgi:tetratricopeptide (TPR) repeat protein
MQSKTTSSLVSGFVRAIFLIAAAWSMAIGPAQAQLAADDKACAEMKGDPAIEACTRVIESKDNKKIKLDRVYFNRGVEWSAKKDYDRAIADYTAAIKIDPQYREAYNNRAIAYRRKNDNERAIADYTEAIRLSPQRGMYYRNRGTALTDLREYARALADYNEAIKIDANDASANDSASWIMATAPDAKLRDGKRAVTLAMKACELTQWKNGSYVDTLAAAYAEDGNFPEAVRRQEQALADAEFEKSEGKNARTRLKLYKSGKPVRLKAK